MMESRGLRFHTRPGSSDEKAIREVVVNNSYQKKWFKIEPGEHWLDLGGNVGAFTVLAASLGAKVDTYEPDPFNCGMIVKNLFENKLNAHIHSRAVTTSSGPATLNLWPEGQSWRNSLVRNRKGTNPITVECVAFMSLLKPDICIKMDIEGSEIEILRQWPMGSQVKKLVFEWSFDANPNVSLLREALVLLKLDFKNVKYSTQVDKIDQWKFFPPCTTVFCWN